MLPGIRDFPEEDANTREGPLIFYLAKILPKTWTGKKMDCKETPSATFDPSLPITYIPHN